VSNPVIQRLDKVIEQLYESAEAPHPLFVSQFGPGKDVKWESCEQKNQARAPSDNASFRAH